MEPVKGKYCVWDAFMADLLGRRDYWRLSGLFLHPSLENFANSRGLVFPVCGLLCGSSAAVG